MKLKTIALRILSPIALLAVGGLLGSVLSRQLVSSELNRVSVHDVDHWGRIRGARYFVRGVESGDHRLYLDVWGESRELDGFAFDTFSVDTASSNMVVEFTIQPGRDHGVFEGRAYLDYSVEDQSIQFIKAILLKNPGTSSEVAPHMLPDRLYVKGVFTSGMSTFRWKLLSMLED